MNIGSHLNLAAFFPLLKIDSIPYQYPTESGGGAHCQREAFGDGSKVALFGRRHKKEKKEPKDRMIKHLQQNSNVMLCEGSMWLEPATD